MSCLRRFHMMPAVALAAGLLAATLPGAWAATLDVAPTQSLVDAVEAAAPGDVLRLGKGEYAGPVVIRKHLTIEAVVDAIV